MHVEPEPWRTGKTFAEALRSEKGWGHAPLNIWKAIRHCQNVRVARHGFGEGQGDGLYLWDAAKQDGLIIVNTSKRPSRQRFTAAHELGHHQIHRRDGESIEIADKDVFDTKNDPAEVAANAFAAYLLLPDAAVCEEMDDLRNGDVTPEHLVELMRTYGVSYQVAANRLNNAGIINQPHRQRLLDEGDGQIEALMRAAGIDDEGLSFRATISNRRSPTRPSSSTAMLSSPLGDSPRSSTDLLTKPLPRRNAGDSAAIARNQKTTMRFSRC